MGLPRQFTPNVDVREAQDSATRCRSMRATAHYTNRQGDEFRRDLVKQTLGMDRVCRPPATAGGHS